LPSAQVCPRIHTWPRSGSSWTCIHSLNNPIHQDQYHQFLRERARTGEIEQHSSAEIDNRNGYYAYTRNDPSPDRTTNQELRGSPSLRWSLTGPDPTPMHLEAKPQRGNKREREARRDIPGTVWTRRDRGGSGERPPARLRRSRRRRGRRHRGARRRRAWPARRGSRVRRGPRTTGSGARTRASAEAGAEASGGRPCVTPRRRGVVSSGFRSTAWR
jgi:hypothetical protein